MNERMLELARQAGLNKPYASDTEYLGNFDWREFGELIVKECVKVCDIVYFDDYPDAEDFERSQEGNAIKQHFGIK